MSRRWHTWRSWRIDVATGNDPVGALLRALDALIAAEGEAGDVWSFGAGHDEGCPVMGGAADAACDCEIVQLRARRAA